MSAPVLSYGVLQGGWPGLEFGYHGRGAGCPVYRVPGSGAEIFLLRSWRPVLAALRSPEFRDLHAVTSDHALAGVTLQRPGGLLRRTSPDADVLRALVNPTWRRAACELLRPALRQAATCRAGTIPGSGGRADLATEFVAPYVRDVIMLAAGLDSTAAGNLVRLSDRTTGTLLHTPAGHGPVRRAWEELYVFTAEAISRGRSARGRPGSPVTVGRSLLGRSVAALDAAGLLPGETVEAVTTIYNGLPTITPVLARITAELLARPRVLAAVRADPALAGRAVGEAMRRAAHFTFALPGITHRTVTFDGTVIPAGAAVLPVIHAAERDSARTPDAGWFDLARPRRATLAWGAGVHACLGRHLAVIVLEEAVIALGGLPPLRLSGQAGWLPGTMPVPRDLGVVPC